MYVIINNGERFINKDISDIVKEFGISTVFYDCDSIKPEVGSDSVSVIKESNLFTAVINGGIRSDVLYLISRADNIFSGVIDKLNMVM